MLKSDEVVTVPEIISVTFRLKVRCSISLSIIVKPLRAFLFEFRRLNAIFGFFSTQVLYTYEPIQ